MGVMVMETTQSYTSCVDLGSLGPLSYDDEDSLFCSVLRPIFRSLSVISFFKILGIEFSLLSARDASGVSCLVSFVERREVGN